MLGCFDTRLRSANAFASTTIGSLVGWRRPTVHFRTVFGGIRSAYPTAAKLQPLSLSTPPYVLHITHVHNIVPCVNSVNLIIICVYSSHRCGHWVSITYRQETPEFTTKQEATKQRLTFEEHTAKANSGRSPKGSAYGSLKVQNPRCTPFRAPAWKAPFLGVNPGRLELPATPTVNHVVD